MAWQRPELTLRKEATQSIKTALRQMETIRADSRKLEQEIQKTARALGEAQLVHLLCSLSVDELNRDSS